MEAGIVVIHPEGYNYVEHSNTPNKTMEESVVIYPEGYHYPYIR
jgi:hypothetical protein